MLNSFHNSVTAGKGWNLHKNLYKNFMGHSLNKYEVVQVQVYCSAPLISWHNGAWRHTRRSSSEVWSQANMTSAFDCIYTQSFFVLLLTYWKGTASQAFSTVCSEVALDGLFHCLESSATLAETVIHQQTLRVVCSRLYEVKDNLLASERETMASIALAVYRKTELAMLFIQLSMWVLCYVNVWCRTAVRCWHWHLTCRTRPCGCHAVSLAAVALWFSLPYPKVTRLRSRKGKDNLYCSKYFTEINVQNLSWTLVS